MRALLLVLAVLAVTATPAQAAPTCSEPAAREAITADEGLEQAVRETRAVMDDQEIFDVYDVAELVCHDLTGDGRPEMAVYLDCCTAASPTPLVIFRPRGDGWRLSYRSTKLLISSVTRRKRTLRLRHPVYRRTDRLCCPSSSTRYVIRYEDGAFVRQARAST